MKFRWIGALENFMPETHRRQSLNGVALNILTKMKYPFFSILFLSVLAIFRSALFAQSGMVYIAAGDTHADIVKKATLVRPTARQLRWQKLELTAFMHFGINTFTGREWGDGQEDPTIFNPSELDARQWVSILKEAGFGQVIITAKHHDGFCLWLSGYTEHSVKNSPWKEGRGDVVREVADACREFGIGFGIYLSPWDRHHPSYGEGKAYNDYFVNQLTELLTQYGEVDEVWFDGANGEGPNGKKQEYDFDNWYKLIRKLQPQAVIAVMGPDVRWVGTETGKGRETEWSVVPVDQSLQAKIAADSQQDVDFKPIGSAMKKDLGSREAIKNAKALVWYPAETDVSIRPGWFYRPEEDSKVKTVNQLMDIYFTSVGMNGVLLLNIPPDKRGLIHEADSRVLAEWKSKRDQLFSDNLAKEAKVTSSSGKNAKVLLNNDYHDAFAAAAKDTSVWVQFDLKNNAAFDVLLLQEDISQGQRVEKFVLEYERNGRWEKAAEGTTIGYKRLLRFAPIKASKLRLFVEARSTPVLSSFGIYRSVE